MLKTNKDVLSSLCPAENALKRILFLMIETSVANFQQKDPQSNNLKC